MFKSIYLTEQTLINFQAPFRRYNTTRTINIGICRLVVLLLIGGSFSSCSHYPEQVQQALKLSGKNKNELIKVISHYSSNPKDSLKLKAAYFLISNMPGKFYYEGELIDKYYQYISKVEAPPSLLDSIETLYGPFDHNRLKIKYDLEELSASFLIKNIEMAFKVWQEQPWGKDINFHQFCEYILPYRNGDEVPAYDRAKFYRKYNHLLDSVRTIDGDALQACFTVNSALKKEGWAFFVQGGFLPYFSADKLFNQKKGNCRDMVSKTIFIMRSLGIPVAIEFTPNWGNRSGDHMWNVVLDKSGKHHPFMGTENNDSREIEGGAHYTLAKVYLNTFNSQSDAKYLLDETKGDVPEFFKNRNFKDVTNEIKGSGAIAIQLNNKITTQKVVYLCVFNNVEWTPIDWTPVEDRKAVFKSIIGGVVYLPAYYEGGLLKPAGLPFLFTVDRKVKYFSPNQNEKQMVTISRKYPVFMKTDYASHMFEGQFQASDNINFAHPKTLWTIPYPEVEMKWYDVDVSLTKRYKYYRYLSPKNGFGNIAELEFYEKGTKLKGTPIGTPGSYFNIPENYFTVAFDGDEATCFNYKEASNGWTGLELEKLAKVDHIRFLPRNDDNGIDVGQNYQLVYWQNNQWVPIGTKVATSDRLTFSGVPTNSLLLLHNLTKGKEERIFTYEGMKQVWW